MAHVENAGDIRWGNDDALGGLFRVGIGVEKAFLIPKFWVDGLTH